MYGGAGVHTDFGGDIQLLSPGGRQVFGIEGGKAQVDAFHAAALAAGARDEGAPGPRPLYGEPYYGCFIRDLDGHKVEASYWDMSQGFDAHDHAH